MKPKIIIDTDPGVDDALAIQFALSAASLEVVGLTTVFGNVSVELATVKGPPPHQRVPPGKRPGGSGPDPRHFAEKQSVIHSSTHSSGF
jgi:hypothetical protein